MKVLAVDIGASGGKMTVFDEMMYATEVHRFDNDPVMVCGEFKWDILRLFREVKIGIKKAAGMGITSLAINTWGVDYGLLDADGKLIGNPYHYRDARTTAAIEECHGKMSAKEIYERTGIQHNFFNTLYQMIAEVKTEQFKIAKTALFIPDLLSYMLTGVMKTEYTIASTSQMLNARTRDFDRELMDIFGIPNLFPPICESGEEYGYLTKEIKEELGIDYDILVRSAPAHDTASAVYSIASLDDSSAYVSMGTWLLIGTLENEAIITDKSFSYNLTNEGSPNGKYRLLKNLMGLWLIQETRRDFISQGKEYSYNDLEQMAIEAKEQGIENLARINPNASKFIESGHMIQRIYEYIEEYGGKKPESDGELMLVIYRSLALEIREVIRQLEDIRGKEINKIFLVGGGTRDKFLCSMIAEETGKETKALHVEASGMGNAKIQIERNLFS